MAHAPLLISYQDSARPLPAADAALEQGCHGIRLDLQLKLFGSSRSNCERMIRYPRLQDLFESYGDRMFLDIGLPRRGMESEILDAVRRRGSRENFVVSSAIPEVVLELKARSGALPVGFVCKRPFALAGWREMPADYMVVHYPLITKKLVQMIHDSARKIFAWTVNDAKSMIRLAGWGVDGIISSDPKLLVATVGGA